jgi:hypothetical protein
MSLTLKKIHCVSYFSFFFVAVFYCFPKNVTAILQQCVNLHRLNQTDKYVNCAVVNAKNREGLHFCRYIDVPTRYIYFYSMNTVSVCAEGF